MSRDHLWVYGTLRRGCANQHARLLERSAVFVAVAKVQARLYRVKSYPGVRLGGEENDWVIGDLFRLVDPKALELLDRYEGEEFQRVRTKCAMEDGSLVMCWVYEYLGRVHEDRRIASGDWLEAKG